MKTAVIVIISIAVIGILYFVLRPKPTTYNQTGTSGTTDQMLVNTQCKDNWLCATTTILGGLGGILEGVDWGSFNFGGDSQEQDNEDDLSNLIA